MRTNQSRVTIGNLVPCLSYWVVVSSVDCVNRISSPPRLLGLYDLAQFKLGISFGDTVTCKTWVVEDFASKLSDVQTSVTRAMEDSSCGIAVPCVANSQFTCGNDPNLINYE